MRLLLDTSVYLRWLADDAQLAKPARDAIASPRSVVHVSAASLWEISIKHALGRLELEEVDLVAEISANGFVELSVSASHVWASNGLPSELEDPFDRLLVAQARSEGLTLVTPDRGLEEFGILVI